MRSPFSLFSPTWDPGCSLILFDTVDVICLIQYIYWKVEISKFVYTGPMAELWPQNIKPFMAFPLIVQVLGLSVVLLLVWSRSESWRRWFWGGTQYERENEGRAYSFLCLPSSPSGLPGSRAEGRGGAHLVIWKKTPRQGATVLLITCGDLRKMRQLKRQQAKYFKQGGKTDRKIKEQSLASNWCLIKV